VTWANCSGDEGEIVCKLDFGHEEWAKSIFGHLQPARVRGIHAAELGLSIVERRRADAMLAVDHLRMSAFFLLPLLHQAVSQH
jgi:hypothetical protein